MVHEMVPGIAPAIVIIAPVRLLAGAAVQPPGRSSGFAVHQVVFFTRTHRAVRREPIDDAAQFGVPPVAHRPVIQRGGAVKISGLRADVIQHQQQTGPLRLMAGLDAPGFEQIIRLVPVIGVIGEGQFSS